MRVDAARDAREERGDDEHADLVACDVHAGGLRRDVVLTDGDGRAAVAGAHDHVERGDAEHRDDERVGERGVGRDAEQALAAVGQRGEDRVDQHADDLAEAQRDDGEVVALQAQRGHADEEREERRHQAAAHQRERIDRGGLRQELGGQHGGGVSAHGHEARVAQRQLAQIAAGEVQAGRHDDGVADLDEQRVHGDAVRGGIAHHQKEDEDADEVDQG